MELNYRFTIRTHYTTETVKELYILVLSIKRLLRFIVFSIDISFEDDVL